MNSWKRGFWAKEQEISQVRGKGVPGSGHWKCGRVGHSREL